MKRASISLAVRLMPVALGTRGTQRLSILIYHRVLPEHDSMCPYEPTVEAFDWQMRLLRRHFNPLPLMEGIEKLQAGELPDRAASVIGVTNCAPLLVSTQVTEAPALRTSRMSSGVL